MKKRIIQVFTALLTMALCFYPWLVAVFVFPAMKRLDESAEVMAFMSLLAFGFACFVAVFFMMLHAYAEDRDKR